MKLGCIARTALSRVRSGAGRLGRRAARHWKAAAAGAGLCAVVAGVVLFWPMEPAPFLNRASSAEVVDRDGRLLYAFLNREEQWCFPRELDEVSRYLVQATIATEDQRFRGHCGVDPIAVGRAAWQNLSGRRIVSGASTLTMQVVKQAEHPSRSLWGKARQAVQAVRLERNASKDAILRAYLNSAPYGMNIVGCEAAARRYFGKPARELTLGEAALLAGLPKSPVGYMPLKNPKSALARRNLVLRRMRDEGFISAAACERAMAQALNVKWHEFPAHSPHLAMRLKPEALRSGLVRTTIDLDMQMRVEGMARTAVEGHDSEIGNAAVLVVEVGTGSVLARVGSADFYNTPGGGQVDACRARRSPGSALKPFTYALAMENDLLYGSEMLLDGSVDYGLYAPENYDSQYRGLISAGYALKRSLNVPAVTVLERIGPEALHRFLMDAGFTTLNKTPAHYGLGLTLGNCEVCLEELAGAYLMLANLGEARELRIVEGAPPAPVKRVLSTGTCLKLYEMLEQPLPAELDRGLIRAAGVAPRVCWKTGTSTGYHDAWTVVFNRQYVVAAWMGNNDATSSRWLVGARAALPLAANVFRAMQPTSAPAWPAAGSELREAEVCAVTGLPASKWCRQTRHVLLPKAQYLHRRCDVHYPARDGSEEPEIRERWPGTVKKWDLADVRQPRTATQAATTRTKNLRVLEPAQGAEYVLTGEPNGDRVRLQASVDGLTALHWYADGRYLGAATRDAPVFFALNLGKHEVTCMNGVGAMDTVAFEVTSPGGDMVFKN
jgi:penicillin-binding protein 1C